MPNAHSFSEAERSQFIFRAKHPKCTSVLPFRAAPVYLKYTNDTDNQPVPVYLKYINHTYNQPVSLLRAAPECLQYINQTNNHAASTPLHAAFAYPQYINQTHAGHKDDAAACEYYLPGELTVVN